MVEEKNATVSTLSVTIQALHVSGKQMTLAVFKQLPCRGLSDGITPWGFVSYEIKGEGDLWLVFSHNGILFRTRKPHVIEERTNLKCAKANLGEIRSSIAFQEKEIAECEAKYIAMRRRAIGMRDALRRGDSMATVFARQNRYDNIEMMCNLENDEADGITEDRRLPELRAALEATRAKVGRAEDDVSDADANLRSQQALVDMWDSLSRTCPQLFIAV